MVMPTPAAYILLDVMERSVESTKLGRNRGSVIVVFRSMDELGDLQNLICLALLTMYNEWGSAKQGVASFILWAGLFKGLAFIAFPRVLFGIWDTLFPQGKVARILGIVIIALGAALVWWART